MSSIYMVRFPLAICVWNRVFIVAWKVTSELVRLKNITVGLNSPSLVVKAAFHSCPFFILTVL
jgi:hypothetical protein